MVNPAAFLCHATADNDQVRPLALDLRLQGIDVWFDEWEIRVGDSLRRKIEEGISNAEFFMVVLSQASIASEWVQTELDAALVQRINGHCALLPILLGIERKDVPVLLQGIRHVTLASYDDALAELVRVCQRRNERPTLATAPTNDSTPGLGLTPDAETLSRYLCNVDEIGAAGHCVHEMSDLVGPTGLSASALELAADELREFGFVTLSHSIAGQSTVMTTDRLFWRFDPFVKGWNCTDDAIAIANVLVGEVQDTVGSEDLDRTLGWGHRRLNPAMTYLVAKGCADSAEVFGSQPYALPYLIVTTATERLNRRGSWE